VAGNREDKLTHVNNGTIDQMLVYRDGRCAGWCQFGPPAEVASIKNALAYEKAWPSCLTGGSAACSPAPGPAAKAWREPELARYWPR
jgi:hypothetical protein